ncbi:hypothetical protein BKA82DRAFT_1000816 [Pisolithus tinctorius]|uniref:Uncharacterized protein n=1 Tax=Pisolithus tinctorius Marx 270 TaxID=870435 RepID=A0A0C3J4H1_PISTI|nr:hypothetical protein BKA82DRAFT_1000816 [Pisolithus tinctorius]KIO03973.1 hypothetical protein M404DRAFT_1000816 [Pisolithus tinctorius Marx 270]
MSDNAYRHYYVLSGKSKVLKRNLFIWSTYAQLHGGLHIYPRRPITVSALYTWIGTLVLRGPRPFTRHYVEVTHSSLNEIFRFEVVPVGDDLPHTSDTFLRPGDLDIFPGKACPKPFEFGFLKLSFFDEEQVYMRDPDAHLKNDMSANFVEDFVS